MAHTPAAPTREGAEASTGYLLLPRQLRQDGRHVGINTLKLVLSIADATLGWDFSRWAALTYRAIVTEAGRDRETKTAKMGHFVLGTC